MGDRGPRGLGRRGHSRSGAERRGNEGDELRDTWGPTRGWLPWGMDVQRGSEKKEAGWEGVATAGDTE